MSRRIEVVLLPTSECPKLTGIAVALSQVQDVFRFRVIGEGKDEPRIRIRKINLLKEESNQVLPFHEARILKTYVDQADWSAQIAEFMKRNGGVESAFEHTSTLAVCVGSGTYIDEQLMSHFYFSSDDSYTSLYEFRSDENPTAKGDVINTTWKSGIISLIQFEPIFQIKPDTIDSEKGRADFGRYIVMNLVHFLGTRSFWNKLARDHVVRDCVMETSWTDADYLSAYYTTGLCKECKDLVVSRPNDEQVSNLLPWFSVPTLYASIEKMCALPKRWDNIVRKILGLRTMALSFLSVFGVGLFANILASVDFDSEQGSLLSQAWKNFGKHPLPLIVCAISILLSALAYGFRMFLRRCALP